MASFYDEEFVAAVSGIALAGDGIVLGVGMTLLALHTWVKYRFRAGAVKQLRATPLSHIADLRSLLLSAAAAGNGSQLVQDAMPERQVASSKEHYRQQPQQQGSELLVIVRGSVVPKSYIKAEWQGAHSEEIAVAQNSGQLANSVGKFQAVRKLTPIQDPKSYINPESQGEHNAGIIVAENSGEKALVVEKIQTCIYHERRGIFGWRLEWKSLLGWSSLKEEITSSRRVVPFVLVEGFSRSSPTFTSINLANSRHPLPLTTVYHQLHPTQPASYTFLQAIFGQRYMVGILDEEKILPIGKEVTAIGLLTSHPDGSPVIEPSNDMPCFLTNYTRDQLIKELADEAKVLFWVGVLASGIAAGILVYSISKNWGKWNRWRLERQRQKEQEILTRLSAANDIDVDENVPDGELCVICLLRRRRAAFVSCGHRVCCMGCAHKVVNDQIPRCPVCRHTVETVICIYDA